MIDQAVLLVGGRARRLGALGVDTPKCLQPVNGRPFIAHQLELLASQGIRRVVLLTGYLGTKVQAVVGDGAKYGVSVSYSEDVAPDIGTGGALRDARALLDPAFVLEYGDTYLRAPMADVTDAFARSQAPALMTVYRNEDALEPSNVWMEGGLIRAYGKANRGPEMKYIDYGLSVLSRGALDLLPVHGSADLGLLFETLITRGVLAAFEVRQRFYEIGTPGTLAETEEFLRENHCTPYETGARV